MNYKREEAFRYEFQEPLFCTFRIMRINNVKRKSNYGQAKIHDISPNGLKMSISLNIPLEEQSVEIEIEFLLNNTSITLTGELIWKKKDINIYSYGVKFTISDSLKNHFVNEIKFHSKRMHVE
jgi:hypothetical protein